jgi:ribose 5-phosphate isomerase B
MEPLVRQIVIGCDHAAYKFKQEIVAHLATHCIECVDVGCFSEDSCDYPDIAKSACQRIATGEFEMGILICGSGIGISIAANKF